MRWNATNPPDPQGTHNSRAAMTGTWEGRQCCSLPVHVMLGLTFHWGRSENSLEAAKFGDYTKLMVTKQGLSNHRVGYKKLQLQHNMLKSCLILNIKDHLLQKTLVFPVAKLLFTIGNPAYTGRLFRYAHNGTITHNACCSPWGDRPADIFNSFLDIPLLFKTIPSEQQETSAAWSMCKVEHLYMYFSKPPNNREH